jgi:hypothetical protein
VGALAISGPDELRALSGADLGATGWMIADPGPFRSLTGGGDHEYLMALLPRFAVALYRIDGFSHGLNYGLDDVRFPAPLASGDRIRMRATFSEVRDVPGGLHVHRLTTVETRSGPVLTAQALTRLYLSAPDQECPLLGLPCFTR